MRRMNLVLIFVSAVTAVPAAFSESPVDCAIAAISYRLQMPGWDNVAALCSAHR